VDESIVAIVGVVVGGLLTGGLSYLQSRQQRNWQLADLASTQRAERDKEVRARADAKAEEVLVELEALRDLLAPPAVIRRYAWPDDKAERREAKRSSARLRRSAVYLQQPLRRHVETALRVLPDVDQLGQDGWIEDRHMTAARVQITRTQDMVGRYLRNDPVPQHLTTAVEEYAAGWQSLQDKIEYEIESQLAGQD